MRLRCCGCPCPRELARYRELQGGVRARDRILLERSQQSDHHGCLGRRARRPGFDGGVRAERRNDRLAKVVSAFLLAGLIVPPAVVPTIYVLQKINLFKSLWGLILIEVAYLLPFSVLLFRAFVSTIPRELDEAAMIDGCSGLAAVLQGHLPLAPSRRDHRDRDELGDHLQRLPEPAVLPSRRGQHHRSTDALQLPGPVQHASGTCCSWTCFSSRSRR